MSETLIRKPGLSVNHEADPTQTILCDLAYALHDIAAEHVLETLGDIRELPLKQREALCLTATREILHQLGSSLIAAPQSPLTAEILEPVSQAEAFAKEKIGVRFPESETGGELLATLISAVRANIKAGKRG